MIEDRWGGIGALGCGTPGDSLTFYLPEPLCRVRRAAGGAVRGAIHALYRDTAPCPPLAAPLPLPGSPGFGVRPACPAPRRLTATSLLAGRSGRIVRMASASAGATRSCQTRSRSPSCPSSPPPPRTWTRPRTRTGVSTALPIWLQGPRLGIAERSVLEGTFQTTWCQPPATSRDIFHQPMVLRAPSNLALSTAREGETSLGSLGQCFTTLMVKNFFLLSNVNPPSLSWKPSPLVLSLHALLQLLYKLLSSSERPQGLPAAFSSPGWAAPALPAFRSFPAYLCTVSFDTRAALSSKLKSVENTAARTWKSCESEVGDSDLRIFRRGRGSARPQVPLLGSQDTPRCPTLGRPRGGVAARQAPEHSRGLSVFHKVLAIGCSRGILIILREGHIKDFSFWGEGKVR